MTASLTVLASTVALCACGGNVAPVAIASSSSYAYSQARVQPPTPTPFPTIAASSSDAFVSSMGVDVNLVTPTTSQQASIATSFAGLGIRHTRIAILESDATYDSIVSNFFAKNPSVMAYGLANCAPPLGGYAQAYIGPSDVSAFQSAIGNHLDRVEAVNEPDNQGDPNWVSDTYSCSGALVGGTGGLPFVAPALITQLNGTDENALGNVAQYVQLGNIHRYFSGRNPDTGGWGSADSCGTYGSLAWSICWALVETPSTPLVVTETGWNSVTEVDETTQAKYIERVFFVNAQAGIAATSLYQFLSDKNDAFGDDGLLREDLSAKPSYTAVANMTKMLADPGSTFSPSPLAISMMPAPATSGQGLREMLLGKRDGSYELALWQEVQSADPNNYGSDTVPATVNVAVTMPKKATLTANAWQNDGTVTQTKLGSGTTFSVPVTDAITIVQIQPGK